MKRHVLRKKLFLALAALLAMPMAAQVDVNYSKYPDYSSALRPDYSLMPRAATRSASERPAYVNNAETIHFPAIISQDGGSCGSASRISYMFTYETNAYRNVDGKLPENIYPSHFTWLLTNSNSGKEVMAAANGVPNSTVYGGVTYSQLFGNQDCADKDFGWMQGYDKWYSAMFNRIERSANFPVSVQSEEGREAVKNWLWNHNGDEDFAAGGICGIGVASAGDWQTIPSTAANNANGVTGKYYVGSWGTQVDHALTIVGYDDRIEFDLDGNGVAGEVDKDEVGAWIIANSWGTWWCNKGFIYCPYKHAVTTGTNGSYYMPEVYHVRKDYRPLRTMKIKMEYTKRSEICLSAGISADLSAEEPEQTVLFEHFKYAGDGDGDGVDAATPMLGRWADGLHDEPMEFGYDLTDLSAGFDCRRPLKYFFIIESKGSATGTGTIHNCSVIDYEFDEEGIEFPFDISTQGVTVNNKGKKTIISVVVTGEPLYAPRNLALDGATLSWESPAESMYPLNGYNIYADGSLVESVAGSINSVLLNNASAVLQVAAVYNVNGKEAESALETLSASSFYGKTSTGTNVVRGLGNAGIRIKDLFVETMPAVTIEYWLKPASCVNWNQQVGPGWSGNFMAHTTSLSEFVVGWNTGARITSNTGVLKKSEWNHIAIVVNGGTMVAYVNGENVGTVTSGYNGIGGFGSLDIGCDGASGINGKIDEVRVWNTARSQRDIQAMMYCEVADPQNTPNLLVNLKMASGVTDATGNYEIELLGSGQSWSFDNNLFKDTRTLSAGFKLPDGPYLVGSPVDITNASSANSISWEWSVDGKKYTSENVSVIFETAGEKTITLVSGDAAGNTVTHEQTITVEPMPAPTADFTLPEFVSKGKRISFVNATSPMPGCTFEWSMPGATVESATTLNAAAVYETMGEYSVTLTATNSVGSSSVTKKFNVVGFAPATDFTAANYSILKGEALSLVDASEYSPTKWEWTVYNDKYTYESSEQNPSIILDAPGRYSVKLTASNLLGENSEERENIISVCNADAVTGLNFTNNVSETVTFNNPLDISEGNAFTIDWWMYSKANATYSHSMGGNEFNFMFRSLADGAAQFAICGNYYSSSPGFYVAGAWYHYAVVFNKGKILLYRDGKLFKTLSTRYVNTVPTLPETFALGGVNGALNAVIDEFRMWNRALSADEILAVANAPIDDIPAAEADHSLALYYQFNQSSGDVQDATSNGNTGVRSGFGPDGDAWSKSLGVFCLSSDVTLSVGLLPDKADEVAFVPCAGGVQFESSAPVRVRIYSLTGIVVYDDIVLGTVDLSLPSGVYIIGGRKLVVR